LRFSAGAFSMNLSFFSNEPPLARRLGAMRLHSIHGFLDGAVGRIVGTAGHLAEERAIAPLSGRACAAWFVRVTGAESSTRGGGVPVVEAGGAAPFTVSDETGQAIVRAREVTALLPFDSTETLGAFGKPPPRVLRFLREHRREESPLAIDWRLSWQEGILAEGQRVAVVGRGRREIDPEAAEGGYRRAATRLVMTGAGEDEELFMSTFAGSLGAAR
jgi:hypothetical protein